MPATATRGPGTVAAERVPRPGLWFHLGCALFVVLAFWTFSTPGVGLLRFVATGFLVVVLGVWWLALVVLARGRAWSDRSARRRYAVAPAALVVVAMMIVGSVPLRLRWRTSTDAFDRAAAAYEASGAVPAPGRYGSYRITAVRIVPGGLLFDEETDNGLDDAGFAWLPDGPTPALENSGFERPSWVHLGGPWYAWTASW